MNTLYGISNCDTIKKARRWLTDNGIEYRFHDYRKDGLALEQLQRWSDSLGWESLLNKRGTTWRNLSDDQKQSIDLVSALNLMVQFPAMIKRPLLETEEKAYLGFTQNLYKSIFGPITD